MVLVCIGTCSMAPWWGERWSCSLSFAANAVEGGSEIEDETLREAKRLWEAEPMERLWEALWLGLGNCCGFPVLFVRCTFCPLASYRVEMESPSTALERTGTISDIPSESHKPQLRESLTTWLQVRMMAHEVDDGEWKMEDGEGSKEACIAGGSPSHSKVKMCHFPEDEKLAELMALVEEGGKDTVKICMPLLEKIHDHCMHFGDKEIGDRNDWVEGGRSVRTVSNSLQRCGQLEREDGGDRDAE